MSVRPTPNGGNPSLLLRRTLRRVEGLLRDGGRLDPAELDRLQELAHGWGDCPAALSRRIAHVMATSALRSRELPAPVLQGLYAEVHAATCDDRWSRARVSNSFLDAPTSLVLWRRTAVAACALTAISLGWVLSRDPVQVTRRPLSQVERYALLDGVLERFDPKGATASGVPVPGRGLDVYEVGNVPGPGAARARDAAGYRPRALRIYPFRGSVGVRIRFRQAPKPLPLNPQPNEIERN